MLSLDNACVRLIEAADLPALMRIQAEAYMEEMQESAEVMAARMAQVANTTWVVELAGEISAYLLAYLSRAGQVTPWGSEFAHQPEADTFYVHDLAISRRAQGLKLGPWLIEQVLHQARSRGLGRAALVSVQGTEGFWARLGFTPVSSLSPEQQANLRSYSGAAIYMERPL